ncbi:uncharacterized protein LOC133830554 [Humulus lupulus]|uniref:uncharacterized protein LOC133830554 n=1 Tax=Humulus lupulus TaxID=3486 RepID=UPI002B40AF54|nr:uncharacterized protein LOC133830554 [Humulus lupulus]XP_062116525.1 uncharacterized protein LOC133830554 [Humulus lupulus]
MGDHIVLRVDRLITAQSLESIQGIDCPGSSLRNTCSQKTSEVPTCIVNVDGAEKHVGHEEDEEEPLIQTAECRICQEEDTLTNLEVPCACSGSLKFAHRKCVQRWCNEKGDNTCEICIQPYQPGYTVPTPPSEDRVIDMSEGWTISGAHLDLHDRRLLAVAAAERHFLEDEYDEDPDNNSGGAALCRSTALILIALLILRHALGLPVSDAEHGASTFFTVLFLRACSFLFPCYMVAWAITILQRRRQRREAELAAAEVAFMLQAGQQRALHFTIAPGPAVTPTQEPIVVQ